MPTCNMIGYVFDKFAYIFQIMSMHTCTQTLTYIMDAFFN